MSKRDDLVRKYAGELKEKCGLQADMNLLEKVTIGCGPSIYQDDASTVSASDPKELARIRKNFLVKRLRLKDGPALQQGLERAVDVYGRSNRTKYRAVFYYLLVKHFGRESAYI